jgi:peptide/nickel transport system substrate-binding protein
MKSRTVNACTLSLAASVFLVGLAASSGCTRRASTDADTLTVAIADSPKTLDPRFATDAYGMRLAGLIFTSLVRFGPNLEITGDWAESWDYKDKVFTFRLRPGLSFDDGKGLKRPVTEDDVLFTFATYQGPKSPFASAYKMIEKVEVELTESKRELRLHLSEYSATLLTDLTPLKILPKPEVEAAGDDFTRRLVGSGPFVLTNQTANELELTARADHGWLSPKSKRLSFKVIRDDNTRFLKMIKGEIDIAQQELPPTKISELEKRDDLKIRRYSGTSMTYLLVNLTDPVLKQIEVRRALAEALNRPELIKHKLDGLAEPATSLLTPSNPFFNRSLTPVAFDLEGAKRRLSAVKKDLSQLTLKTSNKDSAIENGKILVSQMTAAGFDVRLQSFEWGTFYDDIQNGRFQLATMRWVGSTDPDLYRMAFHSKELPPSGRNRGRYTNSRLDRLLEEGRKIESLEKRIQHYQEVQQIVFDDLAIIPLWYDLEVAVSRKSVQDYEPPRNGDYSALILAHKKP